MDTLTLTWLHLSDIHFGHGREARHRVDQQIVCDEILRDAGEMVEQFGPPDLVFLTGDIAFKAGPVQEYPRAATWIEQLLTTVKVGKNRLYLVPGNHDVDRVKAVAGFTRRRLHESLREKPADLDELLAQPDELRQLWPKLEPYAEFAQSYAAPPLTPEQPFWTCEQDTPLGRVVLVGLNTVLLSFDNGDDPKNLALGQSQLQRAIQSQPRDTLLLVLQHHPPAWLTDGAKLHALLQDRAHILFCGHVHEQGGLLSAPLHGGEWLELVAGAGHADSNQPAEHAYAWGRLSTGNLVYFPRTWNGKQHRFVPDRNSFAAMAPNGAVTLTWDQLPLALRQWLAGDQGPARRKQPTKTLKTSRQSKQAVVVAAASALQNAYLNHVMVRCGYLSLAGIDPAAAARQDTDTQLNLNAVYTALLTRSPRQEEGRAVMEDPHTLTKEEQLRSALEQLDRNQRLVLQGDPGSGKSTFVNFVALCLAGERVGDEKANLARLTASLPDEEGKDAEEPQPWRHGALLPVPVVLRDFAAGGLPKRGEAKAKHLWDFIESELTAASLADCASWLRKELREHGGLLLLDGLDEVPEAERCREQVRQAIESFVGGFGNCRVLVTSRTYAYQNQGWRLRGFAETVLAPLSDGQIRRFVTRWYELVAGVGRLRAADAAGRAELLKQAIFNRPTLYELAQRPLLLTLMASLHAWRSGDLPEKREELYADTVDLLLNRWEQRLIQRSTQGQLVLIQPSLAEYLKVDKAKVRTVLEGLAYEAHQSQPALVGTADISEDILAGRLLRLSGNPDANITRLVEYLRDRAGLLHSRGVGVYTFPHRSFQEYLSACYLTGPDYPNKIVDLARDDPDRWREVALLAGAKAARGAASTLWQLVDMLCYREPADPSADQKDEWGALIAAQALVETADLTEVNRPNQVKLQRVIDWLTRLIGVGHLPATERVLAGDNLARLGDPRCGVGLRDGLPDFQWIRIPGTGTVQASGQVPSFTGLRLGSGARPDLNTPLDEPFWGTKEDWPVQAKPLEITAFELAVYPVTVAQFRLFVEQGGYREDHYWSKTGREWRDRDGWKAPRYWDDPTWTLANHPVIGVSWYEAEAYCNWLNEQLQLPPGTIRLPTEAEWEWAARGPEGRRYPWGDEWESWRCNSSESGINRTSAVGTFPGGAADWWQKGWPTAEVLHDLAGNVWEWTASEYSEDYSKAGQSVLNANSGGPCVVRGGSWDTGPRGVRGAARYGSQPRFRFNSLGFRLARTFSL